MKKKLIFILIAILSAFYIYSDNHYELEKEYLKTKNYTELEEVNKDFIHSIVLTEDKRFYKHIGVDPIGITRALYKGVKDGKMTEGGSTITQQIVKNVFLSSEKTAERKIKEIFISIFIDLKYSKEEILEYYINLIYYGDGKYGIYDASTHYYKKKPDELELNESALLAGLPQAPSSYSPNVNKEKALKRRNIVLFILFKEKYINKAEYEKYTNTPL